MGTTLSNLAAKYAWIMAGLGAAGGMMRFVGFATLLRIMLSNEFWGIYFAGFALATIIGYIPRAVRFCSAADRIRWYCDRSV